MLRQSQYDAVIRELHDLLIRRRDSRDAAGDGSDPHDAADDDDGVAGGAGETGPAASIALPSIQPQLDVKDLRRRLSTLRAVAVTWKGRPSSSLRRPTILGWTRTTDLVDAIDQLQRGLDQRAAERGDEIDADADAPTPTPPPIDATPTADVRDADPPSHPPVDDPLDVATPVETARQSSVATPTLTPRDSLDDGIEGHVDETTSTFDLWPPAVLDPNDFYGTSSMNESASSNSDSSTRYDPPDYEMEESSRTSSSMEPTPTPFNESASAPTAPSDVDVEEPSEPTLPFTASSPLDAVTPTDAASPRCEEPDSSAFTSSDESDAYSVSSCCCCPS